MFLNGSAHRTGGDKAYQQGERFIPQAVSAHNLEKIGRHGNRAAAEVPFETEEEEE
jgi:hypothetical protein